MTNTTSAKRSFDFKRTDHFLCDPREDLCIVGGKGILIDDERGPLDTPEDKSHPLYDPRLHDALEESFVLNVNALGILETIVIVKLDDLACVAAGRQRVRAARVVNRRRSLRGEPPIKVPAIIRRVSSPAELLSIMIAENEGRRDDDISAKLEKLKRVMATGVSAEDCAPLFNVSPAVIESWLRFDDLAIQRVKNAVQEGKLALGAGIAVARLKEPAAQEKALDDVLSKAKPGEKVSVRAGEKAAKAIAKPNERAPISKPTTLRALLVAARDTPHKGHGVRELAFWEGVEATLVLLGGGSEQVDPRLVTLLGQLTMKGDK